MQVNTEQAQEYIIACMKAKLACFLSGSPGSAKSAIVHQIADRFKLWPIDIRLSQCDPTDLAGFPYFKDGVASYQPLDMWPLEDTPIPEGYTGFCLILDEMNSASMAVQAASYKIILDRYVGQAKLHPKTAVICIGNLSTDNAIVNRLSTAMQSRLIHIEVMVDTLIWLDKWAIQAGIDHRIMAYISRYNEKLYNFDPDHNDKTFACPRTWEFASRLIKDNPNDLTSMIALLAGTLGEGMAREFIMFTAIYKDLPTMRDILANPAVIEINEEPSMLWATSHMVATHTTKGNLATLMQYIERLPVEFTTITLQNIVRKNKAFISEPVIKEWIRIKGPELF